MTIDSYLMNSIIYLGMDVYRSMCNLCTNNEFILYQDFGLAKCKKFS